ncbi:MAG: diguanylate cyclase [Proteobacteria bacterium]|nr:diguanylate cyclase [Pseudomonadota bacterium]MBU1737538.1 diguanylate cyclase [Pseudomonadota bacterium]
MTTPSPEKNSDKNVKILIVDDDPLVLELLGISIKSFGFESIAANNGREAIDLLETNEFTMVITDMMMPEVDGMELLAHVRKRHPQTAVIVVTGYTGTFSYMDVIRAGANDFISKPFNSDELEAKIHRILNEQKLIKKLEYLSNCDPLTELFNRRFFDKKINDEAHRASRQKYPIFLFMLDVDEFKEYNDRFGHPEGDKVLMAIGDILRKCTRSDVDLLFRYGGDEFAIVSPHINRAQACAIGERILACFNQRSFANTGISLGLAEFVRSNALWAEDLADLVTRADKALYTAKSLGRNRMFSDETTAADSPP